MDNNHLKHTDKIEDVDISNQFKDLPVGELICGPLKAVVDAQKNMAEFTSKFIKEVGLKKDESPRYVEFDLQKNNRR